MDGSTVRYDRLLLATGATARSWTVPGGRHTHVMRDVADAKRLRATLNSGSRVVLIGAGFIGLELAASAVARGCCVTVLEQLSQVMGRAVPEPVAARHTQSGVSLFCNTEVVEICQADSGFTVTATDGLSWRADVMIAGIGEVPETQLAEGCGLEVENGIRVNEQLRTSKPDI
jgi:NADPH-dependent 2,4-dienoyl-CoA reductase/sulfur reductase-like enzyme